MKANTPKEIRKGVQAVTMSGELIRYYLLQSGQDCLDCSEKAKKEIKAARAIHDRVRLAAHAAAHAAEVDAGIIDEHGDVTGYEREEQCIGGPILFVRDCRRPDGSDSGIGETASPHDSEEYWLAFRKARRTAIDALEENNRKLLEWWDGTGLDWVIDDMIYRGHQL